MVNVGWLAATFVCSLVRSGGDVKYDRLPIIYTTRARKKEPHNSDNNIAFLFYCQFRWILRWLSLMVVAAGGGVETRQASSLASQSGWLAGCDAMVYPLWLFLGSRARAISPDTK